MRLTKNGELRVNFRHAPQNDGILWKSVHGIKDRFSGLVKRIRKFGLRDYTQLRRPALSCNFTCSYCIAKNQKRHPFSEEHYKQTRLIWDYLSGIEDKIVVRVNFDGETLADEWAMKCSLYVSKIPNVRICEFFTNNSIDPRTYVDLLDPEKTTFNCSFHPEHMSLEKFLNRIDLLKKAGCRVIANTVVIPRLTRELPELVKIFKEKDVVFRPCLLFGYLDGKMFPHDYTESELRSIKKYFYSDFELTYGMGKSPKGRDCYAGVDMLGIFLDGTVKRCGIIKIGHIRDIVSGKVKLKQEPYPCPHDDCINYSYMMGLKEFREKFIMSDDFVDLYYPKK